jgi:ABC-type transport system substrate-binding protein/tRNA A-37 threonylcarbamoyl transferase component Bud32
MRGPLPIGSVIAGYRVLELIGEGAGGTVYLVEKEGTGERSALKLLAAELAHDERFRRRFLRESTIAAGLRHPHVVPILDFGETDGDLFLAMQHIDGVDLRERLARNGPLEPAEALRLVEQIGQALDEAHTRGLVHRDVKPANILLDHDGQAFLSDFGLAKHASSASSLTGDHAFVGTIAYVAPEQIRGEEIDGRADVYSLGCVLFEALAGRLPFDRESELAVVFAHLHEQVPRISDVRPELPAAMDHVLRTATAKDPKHRYATCGELVEAARGALAGQRAPRARPGRLAIACAGVAVAVAAAVAAVLIGGGDDPAPPVHRLAVSRAGLALIDPSTRRVAARVPLRGHPTDVVFDARSAWVLLGPEQRIAQVSIARNAIVRTVKLPFAAGGIALGNGAVFATERAGGPGVVRVATRTGKISARWAVPTRGSRSSDPSGIAAGAGSVWLARGAEVVRIDARRGRVQHRFPLPVTATLLQFADGDLWAASSTNGLVEKIDPAANRIVARVTLHGWLSAMAVAGGSVWVTAVPDDVVFRLNADDASVEGTSPAPSGAESITAVPGTVFVAGSSARELVRLDVASGRRTTIALDGVPELVRYRKGIVWTAATPVPQLPAAVDGPELRVAVAGEGLTLDPALGPDPISSQLLYATCAKLVNYPDAARASGQQLRPDAAVAAPTRSADGRTYTFQIRRGLRFSPPSGAALDARAFKRTIERTLSPELGHSQGLAVMGDIVGARAFHAGRAAHVRGVVARGNTLSITLTKAAGDLPSRLATPVSCAVPAGTPAPGHTSGPIPSAGPYYVRAEAPGRVVVDRNPNYRGPRPRRPARIVYLTGVPSAKAVALADGDQADVVPWDYDLHGAVAPGGALDRRTKGGRYNAVAQPGVDLLAFNTRRPLFADARLRRAVNFALDRPALAAVFGEPAADHYVPSAVPGTSRRQLYPLTGPDLVTARRLAGRRPTKTARLYFCGEPANLRVARIVRANLRAIGIHVVIVPSLGCLSGPDPKARSADILILTRATQVLDPEPFLDDAIGQSTAFGPATLPVTWSDRSYRERVARAHRLDADARLTAYGQIEDDMLRKEAPYAPYGSFVSGEYLSARSACRVIQGAYGVIDLAALCVRSR